MPHQQAERVVIRLFREMGSSLGHRWTSAFGVAVDPNNGTPRLTETARKWLAALGELTAEQVAHGVKKADRMPGDWWPTLQSFRELCMPTPEDLGLPTASDAYKAAANSYWRLHPIVWHAAQAVGVWDLRNKPEALTRPAFKREYEKLLARAATGEVFTLQEEQRAPRIERMPLSKEKKAEHIQALKAALRGRP